MKLYFSTIRIALPNTEVLTYWESGHPDEYDVQELFARSARYHTVAELLTETAEVAFPTISMKRRAPGRMRWRSRATSICWTPITSWPAGTVGPGLSIGRMSARYEHSAFTWNYDGGIEWITDERFRRPTMKKWLRPKLSFVLTVRLAQCCFGKTARAAKYKGCFMQSRERLRRKCLPKNRVP